MSTNYENIKNMSIDELATFLNLECPYCIFKDTDCTYKDCRTGVTEWLESEA